MIKKPSDIIYFIIQNTSGMTVRPGVKYFPIAAFYVAFQCSGVFLFLLSTFLFLLGDTPFTNKLETTQFFISMIHINTRHFNILLRGRFVSKILKEMDRLWAEAKLENLVPEDYEKAQKRIWYYYNISLTGFLMPVPLKVIECIHVNWNRGRDNWAEPLPAWTPFPSTWFWSISLYQMYGFTCALISISCSASLLFALSEYVVLYMKVLQALLITRSRENLYGLRPFKLHQDILRLVLYMNKLLSAQFFLEMVINSIEVAARIYAVIVAISKGNAMIFSFGVLVFLTMATPFTICLCGNYITTQNEFVYKAAYQNLWYEEDVKSRKDLIILMSMATKPVTLHFKHLLTYGMAQFTTFCQAAYSYIMVLRWFGNVV